MKRTLLALGLAASMGVNAGGLSEKSASTWYYSLGMGYTHYTDMMPNDGETRLGRLAISRDVKMVKDYRIGMELGFQTGNQMRLALTSAQNTALGDRAVESYVKPMTDLLITASKPFSSMSGMSGFVKAGAAFRQMHFDRDTINSLKQINPELQIGLSKAVSATAKLSVAYQGIYSGKVGLNITTPPTTPEAGDGRGTVNNLPTQHGVLVTLTMNA